MRAATKKAILLGLVLAAASQGAQVVLDGSGAFDPDGYIKYWRWYRPAMNEGLELVGWIERLSGADPNSLARFGADDEFVEMVKAPKLTLELAVGEYVFGLRAEDNEGALTELAPYDPNDQTDADGWFLVRVYKCRLKMPGDLNGDCYVNLLDLRALAAAWLACGNPWDSACERWLGDGAEG